MDPTSNPSAFSSDKPDLSTEARPPESPHDELASASGSAQRQGSARLVEGAPRTAAGTPDKFSAADLAASIASDQDESIDRELEAAMAELKSSGAAETAPSMPSAGEPKAGDLLRGRVANIGSEDVLIDFGTKMLGVVPKMEIDKHESYAVGDAIEVLVLGTDDVGGLLKVSRKQAKQASIMKNMHVGLVVEGKVTGMNKGGLEVDIEGIRGFIPASQVDVHFVKDISDLIGQAVHVEVTKFDLEEKSVVLSRRKVLQRESEANREKQFDLLKVGETRRGKVKNLAEYGAFVDLGGVDGLLHISDMSWGRVNKPEDVVKVGDEIEVKITKINKEKKKISLSLKQVTPNPWTSAAEKYSAGSKVSGRVVRLQSFGAFVELEPGLDALLPVSEMSWTQRVRQASDVVKEGDVIEAVVLSCEPEKERVSLSLKALKGDPWEAVAERYPAGSKVTGKVVRTTDFGAFVNLEEGVDALIHISELSDRHVKAVTDVVKVGQEIEARVLKLDREAKKIGLSLKEPPPEPSPEEIAREKAEQAAAEKRRNKPRRGGLTIDWGQGLGSLDPSKFAR
ncbi:MAG: S1 RNA-binding domain-containing protein [Phycisphaerae bacterium]|nr:S1 RNA-binding domain-containing protein [Phycisphaerae bacterium]